MSHVAPPTQNRPGYVESLGGGGGGEGRKGEEGGDVGGPSLRDFLPDLGPSSQSSRPSLQLPGVPLRVKTIDFNNFLEKVTCPRLTHSLSLFLSLFLPLSFSLARSRCFFPGLFSSPFPTLYTLHRPPHIPHPTPYILNPTPVTSHRTPYP